MDSIASDVLIPKAVPGNVIAVIRNKSDSFFAGAAEINGVIHIKR